MICYSGVGGLYASNKKQRMLTSPLGRRILRCSSAAFSICPERNKEYSSHITWPFVFANPLMPPTHPEKNFTSLSIKWHFQFLFQLLKKINMKLKLNIDE